MGYLTGIDRGQSTLFPECLDDYVDPEAPVRFLDAFVESLDPQKLKFVNAVPADTGRPGYNPADLLRLYVYGYLNGIRTSRKLEKETYRNLEVMWLIRKLHPDFRTIADFRKNNRESLKGVFREFNALCKRLDLFGGELVGIDGSKFAAVNSKDNNYSKRKLELQLKMLEEKIENYLKEMDQSDRQEDQEQSKPDVTQMIEQLRERKKQKEELLDQLEKSGEQQISLTDPESRRMTSGDGSVVGYNVQIAVDSKHKLVAAFDVTSQGNDLDELANMALKAKQILDSDKLQVVVDSGYYDSHKIKTCEDAGIEVHIRPPAKPNSEGRFSRNQFLYDEAADSYLCPASQRLTPSGRTRNYGRIMIVYQTAACSTCPLRNRCTKQKDRGRRIERWEHEAVLEKVAHRVATHPEILKSRKTLCEHPFGTLKRAWNHSYFLMRGRPNILAETALSFLAYNIKRAMNILGPSQMIQFLAVATP